MLRRTPYTHGEWVGEPALLSAPHSKRSWGKRCLQRLPGKVEKVDVRASVVRGVVEPRYTRQRQHPAQQRSRVGDSQIVDTRHGAPLFHSAVPARRARAVPAHRFDQQTTLAKMTMGRTRHAGVCLVLAALTTMAVIPGVGAFSGGLRVALTQQPHDCSLAASSSSVSPRSLNREGICVCVLVDRLRRQASPCCRLRVPSVCFEKACIACLAIGLRRGLPLVPACCTCCRPQPSLDIGACFRRFQVERNASVCRPACHSQWRGTWPQTG